MNEEFLNHIFKKQHDADAVPSNKEISRWALELFGLLYPEQSKRTLKSVDELETIATDSLNELKRRTCERENKYNGNNIFHSCVKH